MLVHLPACRTEMPYALRKFVATCKPYTCHAPQCILPHLPHSPQVHYENLDRLSGIVDASGFKVSTLDQP